MPETLFHVRWPDDTRDACYSPSSIISTHVESGRAYALRDFLRACRSGLGAASERVREVYGGRGCFRAEAQLAAIEAKAKRFGEADMVHVESVGGHWRKSA